MVADPCTRQRDRPSAFVSVNSPNGLSWVWANTRVLHHPASPIVPHIEIYSNLEHLPLTIFNQRLCVLSTLNLCLLNILDFLLIVKAPYPSIKSRWLGTFFAVSGIWSPANASPPDINSAFVTRLRPNSRRSTVSWPGFVYSRYIWI